MAYWIFALLHHQSKRFHAFSAWPVSFPLISVSSILALVLASVLLQPVLSSGQGRHQADAQAEFSPVSATVEPATLRTDGSEQAVLRVMSREAPLFVSGSSEAEKDLIEKFAGQQQLKLQWMTARNKTELSTSLLEQRADIVLTASPDLRDKSDENIKLTLPWGVSQQQVITRTDTGLISNVDDLTTRQIAVKKSSPAWAELQAILASHPSMSLILIPETSGTLEILQKVASAQYDVTVLDNLEVEKLLPKFLTLDVVFSLTESTTLAWAVSVESEELTESLNSFLKNEYLQSNIALSYQEDLPALQARRVLRVITYPSPVNYYFEKGDLKGFEYDLIERFAERQGMRLDVVLAEQHEEMQSLLVEGKGDIIAASLPRSSLREEEHTAATRAYSHGRPLLIGRSVDTLIPDAQGLSGRRVVLPVSSPYKKLIAAIQKRGTDVELEIAEESEGTNEVLHKVANGLYDLTVINGQELQAHLKRQLNLRAHFSLHEPEPHVWVVRQTDTQLLSALNNFIEKEFRKSFYNVISAKYIENPRILTGGDRLLASIDSLSPYDDLVHKYAELYDFDWRLIVAQMYQESQFNPDAVSYAGAEGLMQIIPETAEFMGLVDVNDPDASIRAGVRYLDYLRGKFNNDLMLEDRIWFSLAAYNAGFTRVHRARALAESMGLDKNKWFDNVEKAMLALAKPFWDGETPQRNCRCGQTVVYVRDIRTLYNNYVRLTQSVKTASHQTRLSQDI